MAASHPLIISLIGKYFITNVFMREHMTHAASSNTPLCQSWSDGWNSL